jgi:phage tail sheath gpL-like
MTRLDGKAYVGFTGTFSGNLTKNGTTNSQYIYPIDLPVNSGSQPCEWAASLAGVAEDKLTQDPARQLGGLVLPGIVGPQRVDLLDDEEQELMLEGGGSTFHVLRDGTVPIGRVVSCYLTNTQGVNDPAFHDIMEIAVSTRIRYDWRTYFRLTYPSNKLADDGSLAAEYDTTVCTPNRAKGSWSGRHMLYAKQGWVINEVANARASVFVIDPNDKNRLNYRLPYDRIGNLMVDAGVLEFQV